MGRAREELKPGPALEAALRPGVPPLVALVGEEDFLKEDALRQVREAVGSDAEVEAFDGPRNDTEAAQFDPARVFDGLRTGSLFGGARIVVVRRADRFVKDAADALGRLFERPVSGAVLVLFLTRLDGRTRLARALTKAGLRVSCKKLFDRPAPWEAGRVPAHRHELGRWTQDRARRAGKRMSPEVAHALTQHTGNDLGRISGVIDTLVTFVGERPAIDAAAVEELVGGAGDETIFRICDDILDGDAARALRSIETAFRRGLDMQAKRVREAQGITLILIGRLHRKMSELYRARRAFEGGTAAAEVMQRFGPPKQGLQPVFERHMSRFDAERLARGLSELRRLEVAIKTGLEKESLPVVFESLVMGLCRGRAPERRFPGGTVRGRRWG